MKIDVLDVVAGGTMMQHYVHGGKKIHFMDIDVVLPSDYCFTQIKINKKYIHEHLWSKMKKKETNDAFENGA